jgi:transcriptional regulator with PAS, ATPase and Fis domain
VTHDTRTLNQLRACATIAIQLLKPVANQPEDSLSLTLNFHEQVLRFEAKLISNALEKHDGRVTPAARDLGISHQGLIEILAGRHKNLKGKDPIRRRRSLMRPKGN